MNINDYIIKDIKALTLDDDVYRASLICQDFTTSHIPIVENDKLIGCFAETDIRTIENLDDKLENHRFLLQRFFADEKATLLELMSLFADNDCNIIPVLDKDKNYIGYYDLSDILDVFADSPFLHRDSESLVVEKIKKDFSISQVAQIVEGNGAKLLGLYVSNETSEEVQVTIKIETLVMNEIIQTFRRYDYNIVTQHVDDEYLEQLKERSDYFKKYLEI